MKTETKNKSDSLHKVKIEDTGTELMISVTSNFYINPDLKAQPAQFDFIGSILLTSFVLSFGVFGVDAIRHLPDFVIDTLQSANLFEFFGRIFSAIIILVFGVYASVVLYILFSLHFSYVFPLRSQSQRVKVSAHEIRRDQTDDKELLSIAPFKAVYLRVRTHHKQFPFSVVMVDVHGRRRLLFQHLSHEQAVYIARVIHRYLKLDAPEGDFIEPDENHSVLEEVAPAKKKA